MICGCRREDVSEPSLELLSFVQRNDRTHDFAITYAKYKKGIDFYNLSP